MKNIMKKPALVILISVLAALTMIGTVIGIVMSQSGKEKGEDVTLTFMTNGGEDIAPITLKKGEEYTLPIAEKDGRVFLEWYYDEGFTSVCPKSVTAEKDQTFYARYGAVLTFATNGGTEIEPRTYYEGEEIGALPVSYKDGFSFGGWYYDTEHRTVVGKKDNIASALTVYARFSEKAETLKKTHEREKRLFVSRPCGKERRRRFT